MTLSRTAGLLVTVVLMLGLVAGLAGSAVAQTQFAGYPVEGSIEFGGQGYLTSDPKNKDRAKFEEYRDMSAGFILPGLQLRFFTPDEAYSTAILGKNWGRQDMEFSLASEQRGVWKFDFGWDQLRKIFSTNARTLMHETSTGVWQAPRIFSLSDFNGQATSRELREISVRWDTARIGFALNLTPDMTLSAQYTRIHKDGQRPFSMVFGTGSGSNFLEIVEPIDQTVHEARAGFTLAREKWQLQAGYVFSAFQQQFGAVTFENPCWQGSAAGGAVPRLTVECAAGDISANSRQFGRSSLPPSNMAHTFSLSGGVSLPLRTRLSGNVTYSLALQDADFLPLATTPCATCNPLPQPSLNGNVQTLNLLVGATSRPLALPLTLSAKYRLYDYHDLSDQFIISNWVLNDRTGEAPQGAWQNTRESFTRHNADVSARYQILQPVATTIGAGWEQWLRSPERAAHETNEFSLKAVVDATPLDWLLARLSYTPSFKRGNYNKRIDPQVLGYGRQFDMAERDRQRVDLMLQVTPLETVSITPTIGWRHDDYIQSAFGLQWETAWSAGIDVSWTPIERLSLSAGYMHELLERDQGSRNTAGNIAFTYIANSEDAVDTFFASGKAALIPKVLDWIVNTNYSTSYGMSKNRTAGIVPGYPAIACPSSCAKRMPAIDDQLVRVESALRYHFAKSWTASLSYAFEQWRHHDWRTNWLPYNPIMAGNPYGDVYLGNDSRDYDNHMIGVTLAYRFK